MTYARRNDHNKAVEEFSTSIRHKGDDPQVYISRAVSNERYGEKIDAIADWSTVLRLAADQPEQELLVNAYVARAVLRADEQDWEGAIADYSAALELNSDFAEIYSNRGVARAALNDFEGALEDHSETIQRLPEYAAAYVNRGNVYGETWQV